MKPQLKHRDLIFYMAKGHSKKEAAEKAGYAEKYAHVICRNLKSMSDNEFEKAVQELGLFHMKK